MTKICLHPYPFIRVLILAVSLIVCTNIFAQYREIYRGLDPENSFNGASFINPSTGYVASTKYIGFTSDSGHTFIPRYINYTNTDYNGFINVNLTFGFDASGVYAFSRDSLLVYGDFGTEPSILFSANGGLTWKLVHHQPINIYTTYYNEGITDIKFQGNIGLAVHHEAVLRSTDRGQTWSIALNSSKGELRKLCFLPSGVAYTVGRGRMFKSLNTGSSWFRVTLPSVNDPDPNFNNLSFLSNDLGFITEKKSGRVFKTNTGGAFWTQTNDEKLLPVGGTDLHFINDSTGFISGEVPYSVFKTSDGGRTWESCKRDTDYQYLLYGMKGLYFFNNQLSWAFGAKEYLLINTDGNFPTLPRAVFSIDTNNVSGTNVVKLLNYSKKNYQYQWFKDGRLISSSYNAAYQHDLYKRIDTIQLVVSNGVDLDTSTIYQAFNVPPIPTITSFSPVIGSTGAVITIRGTNFNSIHNVSFGGVPASSFTIVSSTIIMATVGNGSSGDLELSTTIGKIRLPGFTFVPPPAAAPPVVSSFSPEGGSIGTLVTITGNNFDPDPNNNIVYFGAVKAQVSSASATTLVCMAPTGATYEPISVLNTGTGLAGYSLTPFALTFSDTANFTGNSFTNSFNIFLPNYQHPKEVGAKDLDGDGKADLIATIASYDSISVFRNTSTNGNFSFAERQNIGLITHYGLGRFAVQDLNGDGKADIVGVTNSTNVVALQNTSSPGSLSFLPQVSFPCSDGSHDVAIADLDNDGRPDLAIAGFNYSVVSVLRNISFPANISFTTNTDYPTGGNSKSIAIGDLNNDGLRDIVCLNNNGNFSFFKNQSSRGNISFAPKVDFPAPGSDLYGVIRIVDFDGDKKLDVVIASGQDYSIYRNTTTGNNLSFDPVITYHVPYSVYQNLTFGNLNGDGKPDAVLGDWNKRGMILRRNLSENGSIVNDSLVKIEGTPSNPVVWSAACADFNQDGKLDIAVSSFSDNNIAFFKNNLGGEIEFKICENGNTSIVADLAGSSYQWQVDKGTGYTNLTDNSNYSGAQSLELYFYRIPQSFDGWKYRCTVDGKNSTVYRIKVKTFLQPTVTLTTVDSSLCSGTAISFKANASNGGDQPFYQWQVNGVNVGANTDTYTTSTLKDKDKIRVILISSEYCSNYPSATSNVITVSVKNGSPSVSIKTADTLICAGTPITFTADTLNLGPDPRFQWQVNGTNTGINRPVLVTDGLKNRDAIKLVVSNISNLCASNLSITSNQITMTVKKVKPSVVIAASDTAICPGSAVTFVATSENAGAAPVYQWQVNAVNTGVGSNTFSTSNLTDGSSVRVILTSSEACALPLKDTSNTITIKIDSSTLLPSVGITSTATAVCEGESVRFKATPQNAGANPKYQWLVNGLSTGLDSSSYTTNALKNNDQVSVKLTTTSGCSLGTTVFSNAMKVNVVSRQKVTGKIKAPAATCTNSQIVIQFNSVNVPPGSEIKLWEKINNNNYTIKSIQTSANTDLHFNVTSPSQASALFYFFSITPPSVNNCIDAGNSDTVNVKVEQFDVPTIASDNNKLFITNPGNTALYKWQIQEGSGWKDISTGGTYTVTTIGAYRVQGDKGACTAFSNILTFTIDSFALSGAAGISLYPNPTTGLLVIDSLNISDSWVSLDIIDANSGQKIAGYNVTNQSTITLHLENLPAGIYLTILTKKDGTRAYRKFMKL